MEVIIKMSVNLQTLETIKNKLEIKNIYTEKKHVKDVRKEMYVYLFFW